MVANIIRLQLGRIQKRIEAHHKIPFTYDDGVVKLVADRCTELESGGRMIDAILTNTLLPEVSREFLNRMMEGRPVQRVEGPTRDGEVAYASESASGGAGNGADREGGLMYTTMGGE